jgi:hypothetical protein
MGTIILPSTSTHHKTVCTYYNVNYHFIQVEAEIARGVSSSSSTDLSLATAPPSSLSLSLPLSSPASTSLAGQWAGLSVLDERDELLSSLEQRLAEVAENEKCLKQSLKEVGTY